MSCRVLRVDSRVLHRQVAAPGFGLPVSQAQRGHDLDLRLFECATYRGEIDVDARTALENHQSAYAEVQLVERKLRSAVTERANDAAPVGIAAVHRGLDEARRRHGAGRGPGLVIRFRT